MTDERERFAVTAEFYLCLAHAFQPPRTREQFDAMRDLLAADLQDLGHELGYEIAQSVEDYRHAIEQHDAASLLQLYSRLFLTPPMLARINPAAYLDGGELGATVQALEGIYSRCGVERLETFRDRADHITVQLEFVSYLYARAARDGELPLSGDEFLAAFPARWLPRLLTDLLRAGSDGASSTVYLALAQILRTAVDTDAQQAVPENTREARRQRALDKARAKRTGRQINAAELAEIAAKLRAAGLSADHLPGARVPHHEVG